MSRPNISYPSPIPGPSGYNGGTTSPPASSQLLDPAAFPRRSSLQASRSPSGPRPGPSTLDSSITRLLVVTKQLLQGLEQWAQGYLSEDNVSDIYVRLGDGFESCVTAFHRAGISTRELDSIPHDLRICLEQCLAESPSQESLNLYLPEIRQIIYNLLNGLKTKQAQYKRSVSQAQAAGHPLPDAAAGMGIPTASVSQPSLPGAGIAAGQGSGSVRQARPGASPTPGAGPPSGASAGAGDERLSVRSASSNLSAQPSVSGQREGTSSPAMRNAELAPVDRERERDNRVPSSTALAERAAQRQPSGTTRAAPPPDAFRPPRRLASDSSHPSSSGASTPRDTASSSRQPSPHPPSTSSVSTPTLPSAPAAGPHASTSAPPQSRGVQLKDDGPMPGGYATNKPIPPRPERSSRDRDRDSFATTGGRVSRFSADSDITNTSPIKSPPSRSATRRIGTLAEEDGSAEYENENENVAPDSAFEHALPTGQSMSFSALDAPSLPTLELPSTTISLTPAPDVEPPPDLPPESHRTLAALRGLDSLERRASRRFSSYTFNKMLPSSASPSKRTSQTGSGPQRPAQRRAEREKMPPMPALQERASLGGEGEDASLDRSDSVRSNTSTSSMKVLKTPPAALPLQNGDGAGEPPELSLSQNATPRPPVPQRSGTNTSTGQGTTVTSLNELDLAPVSAAFSASASTSAPNTSASRITIYLQIGRQVKKTRVDLPLSMETLKLLFMERFEYDPGMEDFPDVYVRDPRTGVGYELEDMEDLREGAVLSLNIEPLDQVKQHIDHTFATLLNEVKDMKKALTHSRRISSPVTQTHLAVSSAMTPVSSRHPPAPPSLPSPASKASPRLPSPRLAAAETLTSAQIDDLEKHHEEVLSLRRDLAIMRQIHVDFLSETKESFRSLRQQNDSMKSIITTKVGGSRGLLDNSKAKLESQCSETIQSVEEVQDIIDSAREDAYRRFVTPSAAQMRKIRNDLAKATELADRFNKDVTSVEPTWRATWAQELSRVMEEQKLLAYQTKLGEDLRNDIKDAAEMWSNVEAFVAQRGGDSGVGTPGSVNGGPGGGGGGSRTTSRNYRPPSPDEESGGISNLLMEIRTKEADPTSRLRAIEAQQRQRERERQEKKEEKDEFAGELEGFVKGRKLRKTGGTEEVERARSRRQEQTIKRMLVQEVQGPQHVARVVGAGGGGGGAATTPVPNTGGARIIPQDTGGSVRSGTSGVSGASAGSGAAGTTSAPAGGGGGVSRSASAAGSIADAVGNGDVESKEQRGSGTWSEGSNI